MKHYCDLQMLSEFILEDGGTVKYMDYDEAIYIWDIFAKRRGTGNRLAKAFVAFAKRKGKSIYGVANPQDHVTKMELNRLKRWYHLLGAVDVIMEHNPNAMMYEVKNG